MIPSRTAFPPSDGPGEAQGHRGVILTFLFGEGDASLKSSLLNKIWLFENLDPESLRSLASQFQEQTFAESATVFRLGQAADAFFVIRTGGVVLVRDAVGRPIELLRRLGPGDFFGETELLDGVARSATARATEPSRLLVIEGEAFVEFLRGQPLLRLQLRRAAIERHNASASAAAQRAARRDVRIAIDREVILEPNDGDRIRCHLDNLSFGGMAIEGVPDDWRIRTRVSFRLGLPGKPDLLDFVGVITWRKGRKVGIAFREPTPELRIAISRALQELLPRTSKPS